MPFDFLRRKPKPSEPAGAVTPSGGGAAGAGPARTDRPVPFDAFAEEWRLAGTMWIEGRLSDALNRRESLAISNVTWAPIDGSAGPEPAPGLKSVDPYDIILVLAGAETMPELSAEQRAAYKVRKVPFDIAVEAPPFRVMGTVYLYPGNEPERLMERASDMFVAITDAAVWENPDRMTFKFNLRRGVKFHDGTEFDAEVVKWNIERILNPEFASPQRGLIEPYIKSVEVADKYTVIFRLKQPFAPLLASLAERPGFSVSPTAVKKLGDQKFALNPVGTGPFKFESWMPQAQLTVKRFRGLLGQRKALS